MASSETQIFRALGDLLRLKMVVRLSGGETYTIGSLTQDLGISRQGARKQVKILESAKLIKLKPHGREVEVVLDTQALKKGRQFMEKLELDWDTRLDKLKRLVEG